MSGKLMTLKELSEYLGISERQVIDLVDSNVIIAYKIGGELLRFRKEQIDATRSEINSRLRDAGEEGREDLPVSSIEKRLSIKKAEPLRNSFIDSLRDFFYFSDFYIVSAVIIAVLLLIIIKG
jgi:excisionase family DNA binding protein